MSSYVAIHTCKTCGKSYEAYSPRGVFCSHACRQAYYEQERKAGVKKPKRNNQPKPDIYCPVRSRFDYLEERTFGAGRKAIDSVQGTSTRTLRRHG